MIVFKFNKQFFKVILVIACIFAMFRMPYAVAYGVTEGMGICFNVILPSLFPFMVLSTYIIKADLFSFLYKPFAIISRVLFRQPYCAVPVIIMAMIGGFPVGIKMINGLINNGSISENQAQRLCIFCMNGGPAFIITAVGVNMLGSVRAGVIMFISLCLSSLLSGVLTRFLDDKESSPKAYSQPSSLASLSSAVADALQSILGVCAWVVIFSAIISCMRVFIENKQVFMAVSSLLEVTTGCKMLSGGMPIPVITAVIGFGGICVHCQVLGNIKECGLKYSHFFVCRILHGAIASFIAYLLLLVFPVEIDVFSNAESISTSAFSVSLPAFFTFMGMCIIMILDIDRRKKVW